SYVFLVCFFFQAEDGIRDRNVTGVQTCALPILISTNGIFSAGLKKWIPIKFSCLATPSASCVMGKDEVLEPSTASAFTTFSISRSEERRVGKECRSGV